MDFAGWWKILPFMSLQLQTPTSGLAFKSLQQISISVLIYQRFLACPSSAVQAFHCLLQPDPLLSSLLSTAPRAMIHSSAPSVWWGHLPSSQLSGHSLYLCPAHLESAMWEILGPSCSMSWVAGSTRVSSSMSCLGEGIFPFFLFFPLPSPALSYQLDTVRKVPHSPFRFFLHQMQSSSETPAREVSHSRYRRKFAIPPLAFSNLSTGKHLWPLWLDERISSHVGISYVSWKKTPIFPFLDSHEIPTLRWGGELQVWMPTNNTTGGVFLQKGDLQRHSPSHW